MNEEQRFELVKELVELFESLADIRVSDYNSQPCSKDFKAEVRTKLVVNLMMLLEAN